MAGQRNTVGAAKAPKEEKLKEETLETEVKTPKEETIKEETPKEEKTNKKSKVKTIYGSVILTEEKKGKMIDIRTADGLGFLISEEEYKELVK